MNTPCGCSVPVDTFTRHVPPLQEETGWADGCIVAHLPAARNEEHRDYFWNVMEVDGEYSYRPPEGMVVVPALSPRATTMLLGLYIQP